MTQGRRKRTRSSAPPVIAEARNEEDCDPRTPELELTAVRSELAATKAKIIRLETSFEELKSRLTGLESHVGTQLQQIQQSLLKFVIITPSTIVDEQRAHTPSSRVLEMILSPKGSLKKVMRQTIRQHMFSMRGGIFANSNREILGRKLKFLWCIYRDIFLQLYYNILSATHAKY